MILERHPSPKNVKPVVCWNDRLNVPSLSHLTAAKDYPPHSRTAKCD